MVMLMMRRRKRRRRRRMADGCLHGKDQERSDQERPVSVFTTLVTGASVALMIGNGRSIFDAPYKHIEQVSQCMTVETRSMLASRIQIFSALKILSPTLAGSREIIGDPFKVVSEAIFRRMTF